jgi:hypothetical protein
MAKPVPDWLPECSSSGRVKNGYPGPIKQGNVRSRRTKDDKKS